jgi:HlyD family secretion protein
MAENKANNNVTKIQLRSEEVNEILGVAPKWIIRWGITIIFCVLLIVFIGSAFFKYPDIVVAPSIISSENPPSVIIARANGKITDILFKEGSTVKKNDTIAVIENPAKLNDIKVLTRIIQQFDPNADPLKLQEIIPNHINLNLGELQTQFNSFLKAYSDYKIFLKQNYHSQKIKALETEKIQNNFYYTRLLSQRILTIKDFELTKKQFIRDSQLFVNNVIPTTEYERSQASLISKQQLLESSQLNLTATSLTIERLKQNIMDLRFEQENQSNDLKEDMVNSYYQLVSSLSTWEKNYLLIAPSSGKLTYMNVWSNLQEVKGGDRLFTINPESRGEVFAILTIPFEGIGKVKPGEQVNIKLDGYPYMEFGVVVGAIQSVSNGSTEKGFPAIVQLNKGAITSYGQELNFERDLSGTAEITTDELTLLQRLLNPLKYIFKNKIMKKQ